MQTNVREAAAGTLVLPFFLTLCAPSQFSPKFGTNVACALCRGLAGRICSAPVQAACTYSKKQRTKRKRTVACQGLPSSADSNQDPDKEKSRASSKTPAGEDEQPENLDRSESNAAEPQNVDWREFRYHSARMLYICRTTKAVVAPYACQLSPQASSHSSLGPIMLKRAKLHICFSICRA